MAALTFSSADVSEGAGLKSLSSFATKASSEVDDNTALGNFASMVEAPLVATTLRYLPAVDSGSTASRPESPSMAV